MVPLYFFIASMFIGGIGLLLGNRQNLVRRRRILRTPTTAIAQAPGGAAVEVRGRVVPSEQGLIAAPFSHRPAVWARVTVQRKVGRSRNWQIVHKEEDSREFWIDDGSGQFARVVPQGAEVNVAIEVVGKSGLLRDAQPHVEAFLASRNLKSTGIFGLNQKMRFREEIIQPGESAFALGPSRREPGPPVSDGYRMVPSTVLVMLSAGGEPGGDAELLLSNKNEAQLLKRLLAPTIVGWVCTVIALAAGGVCAAASILDWW